MRFRPLIAAFALAGAVTACGSSALYGVPGARSPAPASAGPPYEVSALVNPAGKKFFGVDAPGAPDSLAPLHSFAASAGTEPNLVGEYMSWNDPLDSRAVTNAWSYGALYYMIWEPYHTTVAAIAQGRSNAYITQVAREVRALNLPVAISFGHEMNGWWYPWGTTSTTGAQFVAAWKLIHRLFAAAGASNVIWVWNPNVINAEPQLRLSAWYPGDAYVSWVGITGYFGDTGPDTFDGVYGPTMQEIRTFTSKPFLIAETSVQSGPGAATAAQNLVGGVLQQPDVLGFIWFNYDKGGVDWQLGTRPDVRDAIAPGLAKLPLVDVRNPRTAR
jgi:mannan endo-1,4-beta-mannosidase